MGILTLNEVRRPFPGAEGFYVRVSEGIRDTVVFLGFGSPTDPKSFEAAGTAFLLSHEECGYLVTAKHVAKALSGAPFCVRVNTTAGKSELIHADGVNWTVHPDDNVDLALIAFGLPVGHNFTAKYLTPGFLINNARHETIDTGLGDQTYTIGLFRLLKGESRNLPIVHTGNIAMLPSDERIPVRDWDDPTQKRVRYVEGYLVECHGLDGLSGSPVFVRPPMIYRETKIGDKEAPVLWPQHQISLLGVWQGAWDAPPDHVLAAGKTGIRVSVGMGIVVPGSRIAEILELPEVKAFRDFQKQLKALETAAMPEVVQRQPTPESPHKEAFTSLLNAAVRTKPQGD